MAETRVTPVNERQQYGGQAVVEGVMMRSPRYFAVACRKESTGEIVIERENVESVTKKWAWLNKPFLRGMLALVDAFYMGTKALMYSANVQTADALAEMDERNSRGVNSAADAEGGTPPLRLSTDHSAAPSRNGKSEHVAAETRAAGAADLASGQAAGPMTGGITAAPEGQPAINGIVIGGTVVFSLLVGMGLFWGIPTLITQALQDRWGHVAVAAAQAAGSNSAPAHLFGGLLGVHHAAPVTSWREGFELNVIDGLIRIAIFLAYIALISQMKNVKRVFMYHGAEHKAINTLEANLPLTVENARNASRIHPRCGTNFIFIVLITAIFVFSVFPRPEYWWERMPLHLLLVPFVAGIAFEILKFAGKHRDQKWASLLIAPGLATQYLTTRVPDDSQIEVALAALTSVWDKEHEPDIELPKPEPAAAVA